MDYSKQKRFSIQEAVRLLCKSDNESFDDSDEDQDSD